MTAKIATQTAQPIPPPLSFPRPIFAALSPHPFLAAHLTANKPNLRANTRIPSEARTPQVNTGSLTHCNGSAVVRLGNTVAVCGVRAELLRLEEGDVEEVDEAAGDDEDHEDDKLRGEVEALGLLVPNIELSTGSTPLLLPGNAPSSFAQTLVTRIRNLLLSSHLVRARDLRIVYTPEAVDEMDDAPRPQLKAHWTLYIDTLFISLDGNAFDAAWLAVLAALRDTRLPKAYYDIDYDAILCDDDPATSAKLHLRGLPVPSTFAVVQGKGEDDEEKAWILSDPDAFEESVCRESVCVVVDQGDKGETVIRKVEKSGGGVVDRAALKGLVRQAGERWGVWRDAIAANE